MMRLLVWPLPALLAWGAAWLVFAWVQRAAPAPAALPLALAAGCAVGVAASGLGRTWWRRGWIAAGFPLSLALLGAASVPPWAWLAPLGVLLLVYPLNAWRDAPLFPTPPGALADLPRHARLAQGARVLDAGCGLGHGLQALRAAYPQSRIEGVEGSWPLRWLCALRCPWAHVRHGNLWLDHWNGYALVYLFQRPESMARAAMKAKAEMAQGAWLASLEFALPDAVPHAQWATSDGRTLWLYHLPLEAA